MSNYERLDEDDYVPFAPDDEGSVSVRHKKNCDNGTDHKPRLIIKREGDGLIKAFCHNCQKAGVYRPTGFMRSISDILEPDNPDDPITLPKDITYNTDEWPIIVKAELFKYDVTYEEIEEYKLGYSPGLKRLIIPIYNKQGVLMRWEGRSFDTNGSKYIKQRVPGATDLFSAGNDDVNQDKTVVLCEDYISAIRISRHLDARALGTVAIPSDELIKLAEDYDYLIVFLDDDNPTVHKAASRIILDAGPLFKNVTRVDNPDNQDPKRYNRIELRQLLGITQLDLLQTEDFK